MAEPPLTWIDASAPRSAPLPKGKAPSLLPPGARPIVGREPRAAATDLVVPLLVALVLAASVYPFVREKRAEGQARALASRELGAAAELAENAARRAAATSRLAALLVTTRSRQRELLSRRCEDESWCHDRVVRIDASARLAERLAADARGADSRAVASAPLSTGLFRERIAALRAEYSEAPSGWRRDYVEAELALLEGAAREAGP